VSFYNFGFGTEMPAAFEEQVYKYTGIHMNVSFPLPKPLFDRTSRKFATYNMAIPDQFRVNMFEEELRDRWLSGKEPFPRLQVVRKIRNDGAVYLGPFSAAGKMRATLFMIQQVFPLRQCRQKELPRRSRPCLYYQTGRCPGPCRDKISSEEYRVGLMAF
jgi:hypothetical protein